MNKRKLTALGLTFALAAGVAAPPLATFANDVGEEFPHIIKTHEQIFDGSKDQYAGKTVILHSNDVHGAIDGYAWIAELEDDFEAAGAEVITMDAGDYSQGSPNVSASKGAAAIQMMNVAGYEFATIGNHEMDYGFAQLKENMTQAKFGVLCADVLENGSTIFQGETLYETKGGTKIGIFGMETPETQTKINPALIQGLTFLSNSSGKTEIYDCANQEVEKLKEQKADIVIALAHLGMDEESKGEGHRSIDMYQHTEGIDMILDGHSHDVMTEGPNGEPIQSTGTKFDNIGVVIIDDSTKKISEHYLVDTEGLEKDAETEAAAKEITDRVDAEYGAEIATSEVTFASEKTENRCYETNTGDLVTDAMRWEVGKSTTSLTTPEDNVVAIFNGGGLRAGLVPGPVTKKDIKTILPFGNTLCVVYVSGQELLETLEASTFSTPAASGGFPQTNGIKFTIDTTKEYDQGELYPDSTYYKPASIRRVTIESINGKPFDANATYAVITNNFNAAGGDTYYALKAASSSFDTGYPIDEIVSDFIVNALDGKLTAERYGTARGDITIIKEPEETAAPSASPAATTAPSASPAVTVTPSAPVKLNTPVIKKLKTGSKKLTVTWKKAKGTFTGYEIAYSTGKKFTAKKTKTVKVSAKKTSKTIKKLSKKKTYYVRIRTYLKKDGKVIRSSWSKVKKIKIK